jgi:hypothetical protein
MVPYLLNGMDYEMTVQNGDKNTWYETKGTKKIHRKKTKFMLLQVLESHVTL